MKHQPYLSEYTSSTEYESLIQRAKLLRHLDGDITVSVIHGLHLHNDLSVFIGNLTSPKTSHTL